MPRDDWAPIERANAAGTLFRVMGVPGIPGGVVAVHLFATDDGFRFVDGNWTASMPSSHVAHEVKGRVTASHGMMAAFQDADSGELLTISPIEDGEPEVAIMRNHLRACRRTQAEDRMLAHEHVKASFGL